MAALKGGEGEGEAGSPLLGEKVSTRIPSPGGEGQGEGEKEKQAVQHRKIAVSALILRTMFVCALALIFHNYDYSPHRTLKRHIRQARLLSVIGKSSMLAGPNAGSSANISSKLRLT